MGNAYTYNMPAGIPGVVNRVGGRAPDIEAQIMDPTNPLPLYGLAGQIDATSQYFRALAAGDTAIYGFLVRPYPEQPTTASGFSGSVTLGTAAVPPQFQTAIDVLKSGYMTVILYAATAAAKGGVVYVRKQNAGAGEVVGGAEAAADGGNTITLDAKSYFMGPADANNFVELAFNI